jgi:glycosyltransferase involved in cell wall biosynthesis
MRVLHVQKVAGVGGSERHLLSLLPGLREAGVEVRLFVAATGRARDFVDRLRDLRIPHSVAPAGPDLNPLLISALWREMRAFRPDLVHTHLIHADLHGHAAARLAGVPGVSSVHSTHGFYGREPYRSAARIAARSARLTIAISDHVRRYLDRLGVTRRGAVRTIHYGIDASEWLATSEQRARAKSDLGLHDDEIAVGVASRLIPHKGHDFLLEGYARAAREVPELRLLIAGDGPLRTELADRAQGENGKIRFLGFVDDIRSFIWGCDMLAFPSQPEFGEGFGLAALEAMAAGRPVIATAVSSLPEVVGQHGGALVDPADPSELARTLVKLGQDGALRAAMGERGHTRARTTFSREAMTKRTLAVYGEVA